MRAVYHIDENTKWNMVLANTGNMIDYCESAGLDYEIEVVANGEAVAGYVKDRQPDLIGQMEKLALKKVCFAACANALRGNEIRPEQLTACVTIVPAGVVELVKKQEEGFAYIRP